MTIEITESLITKLRKNHLDLENYFVILAIYQEEISLLGIYDEKFTRGETLVQQYQKLIRTNWILCNNDDGDSVFSLTDKALNLIETG